MPIPDYQTLMLPLLRAAEDQKEHGLGEVIEVLADNFGLTRDERTELLPSGMQAIFRNRVAWAGTYLRKAGLLERTGRGKFRISPRGKDVLKKNPERIDNTLLSQFPDFVEFRTPKRTAETDTELLKKTPEEAAAEALNPEETLESSYQSLKRNLAVELLERIATCSPKFFESLVIDLLVAMGYGGSRKDAGQAIGRGGDEGVDGVIKEDRLGLDVIYVQAKKWKSTVGRPDVQAFAGSLEGQRARKGIFITMSEFSREAKEYTSRIEKKIILLDGEALANLMIEHGIGVTEVSTYSVKKVDSDYFEED